MKQLTWFAAAGAAAYFLWACLMFFAQRGMLYPGRQIRVGNALPNEPGLVAHRINLPKASVDAWLLPSFATTSGPAPALIFAHGNGEVMDPWPAELRRFRELGLSVLLVEYPGYGRSTGETSQSSIREAFVAGYDWLVGDPRVDPGKIVGYGHSLGGGAICQLLTQRRLAAVVLQSTFPSVRIFTGRYLLPSFLLRDTFDNVAVLRQYDGPVLIIHGLRDEVIPYSSSAQLTGAARRATLRSYPCAHDCWDPATLPFWSDVEVFFREHGVLPAVRPLA
jgi:uncharacterized protein